MVFADDVAPAAEQTVAAPVAEQTVMSPSEPTPSEQVAPTEDSTTVTTSSNTEESTPVVSDTYSFETLIKFYGPETTQAGGLNFNNTVTANAFSSYYANKEEVGKLPVDKIIEFFVYKHRTQLDY